MAAPTVDTRSASQLAEETGDFTAFDAVVDRYLDEVGARRRHRRVLPDITPRCPACDHPLTGSVTPSSHGRPCMTVLAETADGRGIPERCPCGWTPAEGSFQPEPRTRETRPRSGAI